MQHYSYFKQKISTPVIKYGFQGAGKDATRLFNKYHKWVNADFMLQKCFLGQVVK